jgi:hypothetical protein
MGTKVLVSLGTLSLTLASARHARAEEPPFHVREANPVAGARDDAPCTPNFADACGKDPAGNLLAHEPAPIEVELRPQEPRPVQPPTQRDLEWARSSKRRPALFFMPGLLTSAMGGRVSALGIGGEASLVVGFGDEPLAYTPPPIGIFGQAESYAGKYGRYAAGLEAGSILGIEVGYDVREPHDDFARTHGLHLGGYLSLGVLSFALRGSVPLFDTARGMSQGGEIGVAATLKLPIGDYDTINFFHGRPPRGGHRMHFSHARTRAAAAFLGRARSGV